jgi:hypothetical protein
MSTAIGSVYDDQKPTRGPREAITMRRNTPGLIVILAVGILVAPLAVEAQQAGKVYRLGVLERISTALNAANLDAFRHGLRERGYVEG